jgi:hypothetical protein
LTKLAPGQAFQLLRAAGFTPAQATTLTAVGEAESGLNPDAIGDVGLETAKWGPSVGVWQIRTLKAETGRGTARDINQLRGNPAAQARAARAVFASQGFRAWSTYTSGAYRGHMAAAQRAGSSLGAGVPVDPGPSSAVAAQAAAFTGADPAGFSLSDLNPLNWPGALAHGFGNAAGDVAGGAVRLAWSVVQPFALTTMFALGGIGLVLIGANTLTKPAREAVTESTEQAAQGAGSLAMMAV